MRDRALLLITFAGALRRSKLCAIGFEHLTWKPRSLKSLIPRSKTDPDAEGTRIGLPLGRSAAVTEIMDSNTSLAQDPIVSLVAPTGIELPTGGLSLRWPDTPTAQEQRLHQYKLPAALSFARANGLDRVLMDSPRARLGIVTVGKSYSDTRQALRRLGIDDDLSPSCRHWTRQSISW